MKNKKWWLWGGIGLFVIVLVIIATTGGGETGTKVTVEKVKRATIVESVTANGRIQSALDIKISSDVSGEITELNVREGQVVMPGDLLLKIKPEMYLAALSRADASLNSSVAQTANARARLNQVKAQFSNAAKVFERQKELFKQKAISQSEYDNALQAYEVSKAEVDAAEQSVISADFAVKSARAAKAESADQLGRTMIYAPKGGTISNLSVVQGERVVGTAQMTGTEMMRISDMNEMEVHVNVNENDIIRVKLGDTALVEVDSYLNRKFKGIVTEIGNAAQTTGQQVSTDQVINFAVKISIIKDSYTDLLKGKPSNWSPFRPGMSASVEIQTEVALNVASVPIEAVTTRSDSGSSKKPFKKVLKTEEKKDFECVFVVKKGKAYIRPVKTGIQDSRNIYVVGLKLGEEVITGPYKAVSRTLRNKSKVITVKKEDLFEAPETEVEVTEEE